MNPEMGLAARPVAGMALVLMRFIHHARLCGANAAASFSAIWVFTCMDLTYASCRAAVNAAPTQRRASWKNRSVKT